MSSLNGTSLAPGDGIERRRKAWSPEAGLEVAAAARLLIAGPGWWPGATTRTLPPCYATTQH